MINITASMTILFSFLFLMGRVQVQRVDMMDRNINGVKLHDVKYTTCKQKVKKKEASVCVLRGT